MLCNTEAEPFSPMLLRVNNILGHTMQADSLTDKILNYPNNIIITGILITNTVNALKLIVLTLLITRKPLKELVYLYPNYNTMINFVLSLECKN